ncbi:MAG: hypothetical protein U0Z17_06380 [Bacteroidales bacterium]
MEALFGLLNCTKSLHVELLNAIAGVAADNGLTAEKLAEFKTSVDSFGETLDLNGTNLSDRRKTWQDLKLISANNHLLRHQLDPFIHSWVKNHRY